MNRRDVITLLGGTAVTWPLSAHGQAGLPVVGFLYPGFQNALSQQRLSVFRQRLAEAGFIEGRSVAFEYRWAEAKFERLPDLAADLVRRNVSVIVSFSPPAARAAKAATTTIPIVFNMGEDPISEGVVRSLSRPGGNVTGFSDFRNQLAAKRLHLLRETVPKATVIGLLINPTNPNVGPDTRDTENAASETGLVVRVFNAGNEAELETAFAEIGQSRVDALTVNVDIFFRSRPKEIAALAARHAIPAIYEWREFAVAGGLMSYGTDDNEGARQMADYIGRILKGEKAGDLPVQQATKFEFVINLNTARALRLEFPPGLLAIADEVIE